MMDSIYKSSNTWKIREYSNSISEEIDNMSLVIEEIKSALLNGFVVGCYLEYDGAVLTVGDGIYYYRGVKHYVSETDSKISIVEGSYVVIDEEENIRVSGYGNGVVLGRYDGSSFDYSVRNKLIPESATRVPKPMIDSSCGVVDTYSELPETPDTMFYYVTEEMAFYVYYNGWNRVGYNSILPIEVSLS